MAEPLDPPTSIRARRNAMSFVGWGVMRQPRGLRAAGPVPKRQAMSDEALHAAFARLERAIERVERSARGREAAATGLAAGYALLEERHGLLRQRVEEAIGRLDALAPAGEG